MCLYPIYMCLFPIYMCLFPIYKCGRLTYCMYLFHIYKWGKYTFINAEMTRSISLSLPHFFQTIVYRRKIGCDDLRRLHM